MTAVERLTIDSTVTFDLLFETAPGHADAKRLFSLFGRGEVELATAPLGHRLDAKGGIGPRLRALLEAEGVPGLCQLSYPSAATYPGPDFFPGQFVEGFHEAWTAVADDWKRHVDRSPPGPEDSLHVETHLLEQRDVFITNDGPLLTMCRRLRDERGFEVEAMSLTEYLAGRPRR